MGFPRTLWLYWAQGWGDAPDLVRECARSWEATNPNWEVRRLDAASVSSWLDLDVPTVAWNAMGHAHRSAHVRLKLLASYGGVWADATCLSLAPLESWLPAVSASGFFAFRWLPGDVLTDPATQRPYRVGRTRRMASWFLASEVGNELTSRLSSAYAEYWAGSVPTGEQDGNVRRTLGRTAARVLNRVSSLDPGLASLWVHPVVSKFLRARPYLVVNAVLTHLLQTDPHVREIWNRTPVRSALPAHRLYEVWLNTQRSLELVSRGLAEGSPVQKLDWRMPFDRRVWLALVPEEPRDRASATSGAGGADRRHGRSTVVPPR